MSFTEKELRQKVRAAEVQLKLARQGLTDTDFKQAVRLKNKNSLERFTRLMHDIDYETYDSTPDRWLTEETWQRVLVILKLELTKTAAEDEDKLISAFLRKYLALNHSGASRYRVQKYVTELLATRKAKEHENEVFERLKAAFEKEATNEPLEG